MSRTQGLVIIILAAIMAVVAYMLGNWSEQVNPDGIAPHPVAEGEEPSADTAPRNAFSFGISIGLLATGLVYCCLAFGLLIQAKTKGRGASPFIFWVAGLAVLGFALSYLIDDYFY